MRKASFAIAPEGAPAICFTAFSALLFAILGAWPLAALFWLLSFFCLNFFRDPERVPPSGDGLAASPADGRVVAIERRPDPFSGEERQRLSIFMSVFNVHVNRVPVACEIAEIRYIPGKFLNASFDKASEDNERCLWLLKGEEGPKWTVVQIAGLIARRIVCRAEPGDHLKKGERLGMIRFGSRVDLYLPEGYIPAVEKGATVHAGETVIARRAA